MEKHLTTVQWLHISLHNHIRNCTNEDRKHIRELMRHARQREKEQMEKSWVTAKSELYNGEEYGNGEGYLVMEKTFEQYYNETYGKL